MAARMAQCPTGIAGLDEVLGGGLPRGRTALVTGGPGCGKTLLGVEFLVRGIEQGEPGVLVTFEETAREIAEDVANLGWDLEELCRQGRLSIDYVDLQGRLIYETGHYDLDALLLRIGAAIDEVGAKRVVLDTVEVLFGELADTPHLRSEVRRLFSWLKGRDVTAVITAEQGEGSLTRHGLEEYVTDCVIALDHRVDAQMAVRRLRVVKMRGSSHGTNEYPFLIDDRGISVVPVTSFTLTYPASTEIVSTGIEGLDAMIRGGGWYRGSTTIVTGVSGTAKTTFAAHFADAACGRGENCLYFAFEESEAQLVRDMRSVGLDLTRWIDTGRLRIRARRPTQIGLENHLTTLYSEVETHEPDVVVIDPVTDFTALGTNTEVKAMLMRIVDYLKNRQVTTVFTSLLPERATQEDPAISSLIDNWVQLRQLEEGGTTRRRAIYVQKARGLAHSTRVHEFVLADDGVHILGEVHVHE